MTVADTASVTDVEVQAPAHGVTLSESAAAKAKGLLERDGSSDMVLRIAVQPGGCSGLRYELFFDDRTLDGDAVPSSTSWTPSRSRASPSTTPTRRTRARAATRSTDLPQEPPAHAPGVLCCPGPARRVGSNPARTLTVSTATVLSPWRLCLLRSSACRSPSPDQSRPTT